MSNTLAIMFTMTTYGVWLRGDQRGWVDDGIVMPPDPPLEARDKLTMKYEPFYFDQADLLHVGEMIGESLIARLEQKMLALTVQRWHVHFVVVGTEVSVPRVVKCAKDAVRWGLRLDRPIWGDGYDKRFCYDRSAVYARVSYVERHNLENGWPAKPWSFVSEI